MDTSSGSPQAYPSTPGLYNLTTRADGHPVYYTLRIPAGYDGHTTLPVILCLHFGGQPTEFYGGRFLGLIAIPGLGSLSALLVAPTTASERLGNADRGSRGLCGPGRGGAAPRGRYPTSCGDGLQHGRQWHLAYRRQVPLALCGGHSYGGHATARRALDTLRDLPLYVIHSEADQRVPIEDDAQAVARLQAMGAPVEFARLPSGDHFEYRLVIAELRNVCSWLKTVWQQP